MESKVVTVLN